MASLETLLDVETEVESVWDALLTSGVGSSASVVGSDSATEVTTPRIDVVGHVIKWGPHQFTPTSGTYAGRAIYDEFIVRLNLNAVYQPEHAQGPGTIRGKLRKTLTDWTAIKAGFATHGYLFVVGDSMRQSEGWRRIDQDEKTEELSTVLEFKVVLNSAALNAAT